MVEAVEVLRVVEEVVLAEEEECGRGCCSLLAEHPV